MKKSIMTVILLLAVTSAIAGSPGKPGLFMTLPDSFNSPASADLDARGNIYFTSPNFHNDVLVAAGSMRTPAAPRIGRIDGDNNLSDWYVFQAADMEKTSGKVAPMGIGFGPDGNAYVADMQLWFKGESRILRINVRDGQAVSADVVATAFAFPNAVVWKGKDIFVSDTVMHASEGKTVSGVYKVTIDELDAANPLRIKPYIDAENHDRHLFETFVSNGKLGFGANGLTLDGEGNLYTAIMEDGTVLKTTMNSKNARISTILFAGGMIATDGMKWDARTNRIYIADLFANAVYGIDMHGTIELLAKNGDTDGANGGLDGPSAGGPIF